MSFADIMLIIVSGAVASKGAALVFKGAALVGTFIAILTTFAVWVVHVGDKVVD